MYITISVQCNYNCYYAQSIYGAKEALGQDELS